MTILSFDNFSQAYGSFDVFRGLDGKIFSDSKIGLVGPNGIGKTTLLQALAGLEDDMTLIAGGFGLCGIPENLIKEIKRKGTKGLTVISITVGPMNTA